MRERFKRKPIVAVLLPIALLLGVVILIATSIGPLLNAALDTPLVQVENEEGKQVENFKTKNESEKIHLIAKEDGIFELKYDENFSVKVLNEKKEELSIPIYHKETLPSEKVTDTFKKMKEDTEAFYEGEDEKPEKKVACIRVMESEAKGSLYFEVEKDQKQWLEIQRHTSEKVDVELSKTDDENRIQQLLQFESLNKALVEPVSSEAPEKASTSKKQEEKETQESKTQESTKPSESTEKLDETKKQETKSTTTSEEKKQAATKASSEKKNETTDSKAETKGESEKEISKDSDKEETKLPELGTPESYKYVHAVETKKTDASLEKLLKAKYEPEDSLMKPKLLTTSKATKETKGTKSDVPIIIRNANLTVKDGTSSFDIVNPDAPGHDRNDNNNIVRSFDQVSYLVSFSIQNEEPTKKYTNIKYRVIANLDNAVEVIDGVPRNNAEIANGAYIDKDDGSGAQYSKGVMESIISDTGQVFVPIFMNVYGSPHGKKLKPTIKLEIVEATNVETGELEKFNKIYAETDLSKLATPETTVSATPSIKVELVKGEVTDGTVFGLPESNSHQKTHDMGVITILYPLDGRVKGDYRGSTFPTGEIKYKVKQKAAYQTGGSEAYPMSQSDYRIAMRYGFAPAYKDRTSAPWTKIGTVNPEKLKDPLKMPHAKTEQIYTSQPSGTLDLTSIGVYDSGEFSGDPTPTDGSGTEMKNTDYIGVVNPYTYNMTGERTPEATAKVFSSLELLYAWDNRVTEEAARNNRWSSYSNIFYIDEVWYDDEPHGNDTSISYFTSLTSTGGFSGGPTVSKFNRTETGYEIESLNDLAEIGVNTGNVQVARGSLVYITGFPTTSYNKTREIRQILMWDPTTFEYDNNFIPEALEGNHKTIITDRQFVFGVANSLNNSPPYTRKVQQLDTQMGSYTWFDTAEDAIRAGPISAVLTKAKLSPDTFLESGNRAVIPLIPVRVIGPSGSVNSTGKPLVALATTQFLDGNNTILKQVPESGTTETYVPSTFDSSGGLIDRAYGGNWSWTGESIYIKNFAVTTKTEVEKSLYQTNEEIDIKVSGIYTGSASDSYDGALNTTLPKGIHYKLASSKDAYGNVLPEPTPVNNLDGTTTLRWTFSNVSLATGSEVNFSATSDITELEFKDTGYTNSLKVYTVGEMWASNNSSIKDNSREFVRSSSDTFIEYLVQQIILSKNADKPLIEVGDNDPRRPTVEDTSITYKIKMLNESASDIPNARLLEILPFNGDRRETNFSGSYTVKEILVDDKDAIISFSNSSFDPATSDPLTISSSGSWSTYTPGVTPKEAIKDAKSILVTRKDKDTPLKVGKAVELTVKIQPTGQKPGDVFVNNASMNSDLKLPVNSQTVWTRVYGRDLTGYVWYDDDHNGLIGKEDGTPEDPVGDIPVKLYRTSLVDGTYVKQLVKESLTGEEFIDPDTDESNIKTIASGPDKGKYTFSNLPEGDYIAEFMVDDIVNVRKIAIVTEQFKGGAAKVALNSKADPDNFKTPDGDPYYRQPELKDLPTSITAGEYVNHIPHVNAGLTRLSKIKLFKYEEGSVIDIDENGILEPEEIEADTTRALEGAEFQLYKGKKEDISEANKIGEPVKTNASGWLEFGSLPPGDYTIIETKAPPGFELVKKPYEVHVPTFNYIAIVHVADSAQTKLPFTGGTKAMRIILIASACLLVVGMTGVFLHFRPIKVRGGK